MTRHGRPLLLLTVASALALGSCSSSGSDRTAVSGTGAPGTPAATAATRPAAASGMRAGRYCEVLLLDVTDGNATAKVFNSYPLNDCPDDAWKALDAKAIAADQGATLAVLNGPRYWLMDSVDKQFDTAPTRATFGGIEMNQYATVEVGPIAGAMALYTPRSVDRRTVFSFGSGQQVFELVDPDGTRWVMQSWSQQKDPALSEADLPGLGARLQLPAGWRYDARTLDTELRVDTSGAPAQVLQDDLGNSYSRVG